MKKKPQIHGACLRTKSDWSWSQLYRSSWVGAKRMNNRLSFILIAAEVAPEWLSALKWSHSFGQLFPSWKVGDSLHANEFPFFSLYFRIKKSIGSLNQCCYPIQSFENSYLSNDYVYTHSIIENLISLIANVTKTHYILDLSPPYAVKII